MSLEPGGIGLFSDIFLFSLCLIFTGILIFILIYFIITLSDLECDYLNAEECCGKLNFVSWSLSNLNMSITYCFSKSGFNLCEVIWYGTNLLSVEHTETVDAVFNRNDVSIMWTMDFVCHQSSNMCFSR